MADILLNGGDDDDDDDIFVYTGGEQEVPRDVKRVRIAENIDTIPCDAFRGCELLIEVKGHKKLKKIETWAFDDCYSLRWLTKMNGVVEIGDHAFMSCHALSDLEFGKLEIIGNISFAWCKSLRSINLPSIRRVGVNAFFNCTALREAVFGENLGRIESAFNQCTSLRRIAIPLKDGLIVEDRAFIGCGNLSRVDLVGEIHKTISSLHMESWREEIKEEIDRINQTLPDVPSGREKTVAIKEWIESVIDRIEHYKAEHQILLKEAMVLLELALWKAKLDDNGSNIDTESVEVVREEHRVTCGANIVIKNVLPFLALK